MSGKCRKSWRKEHVAAGCERGVRGPKLRGSRAALSLLHGTATSLRILSILLYKRGLAVPPHRAVVRLPQSEMVRKMKSNRTVITVTVARLGASSRDCQAVNSLRHDATATLLNTDSSGPSTVSERQQALQKYLLVS